jgi:ketosteroid isomerase-like protein
MANRTPAETVNQLIGAFNSGTLEGALGEWTLSGTGQDGKPVTMGGLSADVLRRQPDGRWLIAVDNPWGTAILGNLNGGK